MTTKHYRAIAALSFLTIGLGVAACGTNQPATPSTTTTTTTSTTTPATGPSPTEKDVSPTGGNLFTPPVKATPAPEVAPGQHHGLNGVP